MTRRRDFERRCGRDDAREDRPGRGGGGARRRAVLSTTTPTRTSSRKSSRLMASSALGESTSRARRANVIASSVFERFSAISPRLSLAEASASPRRRADARESRRALEKTSRLVQTIELGEDEGERFARARDCYVFFTVHVLQITQNTSPNALGVLVPARTQRAIAPNASSA